MSNKKDWRTQKLVEEFIENIIILPVEAFYPTALLKYDSSLNMENVWNILLEQCQLKKISLKWEVLCTSNDNPSCFRSAGIQEDGDPLLNGEIQCDLCGEDYEIKQENIFPIFVVNEDYQKFMQECFKKKSLNYQK